MDPKSSEEISGEIGALLDAITTLLIVLEKRLPGIHRQFKEALDDPQTPEALGDRADTAKGFYRVRDALLGLRR